MTSTSSRKAIQVGASLPPADLFCPAESDRTDQQTISLPNGKEGKIEIRFLGEGSQKTGLMGRAERGISTTLEGSIRHSTELWSLVPQG